MQSGAARSLVCICGLLVACGNGTAKPAGGDGGTDRRVEDRTALDRGADRQAADLAPRADAAVDAMTPVALGGSVSDFATGRPIAGVQVCWLEHAELPCATTDGRGRYQLGPLPANQEIAVAFSAEGMYPTVAALRLRTNLELRSALLTTAAANAFAGMVGVTLDAGKGLVSAGVVDDAGQGIEGAVFSISPASGKGPLYLSATGVPDETLTATSSYGLAGWMNVDPGTVELTLGPPAGTDCRDSGYNWAGGSDLATRMPVVAGHLSAAINYACEPL